MRKINALEIQSMFDKGMTRNQVAASMEIPLSSLNRYVKQFSLSPPKYVQTQETRRKRAESLVLARQQDPSLLDRQLKGFKVYADKRKGKTLEDLFSGKKAAAIKEKLSKAHEGYSPSVETRIKMSEAQSNRVQPEDVRQKISESRKAGIRNGTIKLADKVGVGKGGFRADIGHYVRSTYEHYYAQKLKEQKISYFYEPKVFEIEVDGQKSSFMPDFYLIEERKWIEIKNPYNAKNAAFLKKLAAFQDQYPNETIEIMIGDRTWIPRPVQPFGA